MSSSLCRHWFSDSLYLQLLVICLLFWFSSLPPEHFRLDLCSLSSLAISFSLVLWFFSFCIVDACLQFNLSFIDSVLCDILLFPGSVVHLNLIVEMCFVSPFVSFSLTSMSFFLSAFFLWLTRSVLQRDALLLHSQIIMLMSSKFVKNHV